MALLLRSVRTTRMGRTADPLSVESEGRAAAGVGVDRCDPARHLASLYLRMGAAQRVVGCTGPAHQPRPPRPRPVILSPDEDVRARKTGRQK